MTPQPYLKSDERRAATVESVISLAAEFNPSTITTTQIAQHMGVTQGALFRHFSSKDAVWAAVMQWVSERLLGRVEDVAAEADSPLAALEAMFLAHVEFVIQHPGVPRMLFGELQNQEDTEAKKIVRHLLGRYAVVIETQVKRGQAIGQIRLNVAPSVVSSLFVGTIQGLVMQALLTGDPSRIGVAAPATFEIFARGIHAEGTHHE
jgi:TetR/AcrR family transcriptional regulator